MSSKIPFENASNAKNSQEKLHFFYMNWETHMRNAFFTYSKSANKIYKKNIDFHR